MNMADLKIKAFNHCSAYGRIEVFGNATDWLPPALASILDGLQNMRDDSALCQALAEHIDFADLAARVAAVAQIRRKLADHDLTDAERAALDQLTADPCEWVRNEAKCALDELSDPLRDQDAEHDGAEDFEPELRTFEARGVTIEDHGRLNYIRANSAGAIRDRAGALLVKLAGVMK
jgi:hypothetical protein